ncbi:MAG TPA: hypothetical protein VIY47_10400 [Ignavibacteriaceae bacterium]
MNTKEKYELIEKLVLSKDENLLLQIKNIIEGTELKLWDEMNPKLKASIQRGLEQSNKGVGIVHEEAMKKYRKKLKK